MKPRRGAFRSWVLLIVVVAQLPAVIVFTHHFRTPFVALGAALLTAAFFFGFRSPFDTAAPSRLHLYVGLWPFFIWWTSCLAFLFLAPLSALILQTTHWPRSLALMPVAALCVVLGFFWTLSRPQLVHKEIFVDNLPSAFDGYRIAQISDVHCGTFTPEARVAKWAQRLTRQHPDLIAVTGDLIGSGNRYIDAVGRALSLLKAPDGVFAAMGNHDYFGDAEQLVAALTRGGIAVLRNEGVLIMRNGQPLYIGGIDDTWTGRANVAKALRKRPHGVATVMLAHDPDLFPALSAAGVELTLSGHTHGGQLAVPGVRRFNLARLMTRFTHGVYRVGKSALYVSRGAGTTGPPVRIGARAELTVLTLRARSV